jgi:putative Mg2+ transporter-C (MgtC) family protein
LESLDVIRNAELFVRIFVAMILGMLIGNERKNRMKSAGMRTHALVALGSALMMVVSKYGFSDTVQGDGARLAAQVVSGVGFLGAGVIFVRNDNVRGLTTAAGIFMTAAVGLCFGSGLYLTGFSAMAILVVMLLILRSIKETIRVNVSLEIRLKPGVNPEEIYHLIHAKGFHNTSCTVSAYPEGYILKAESYTVKNDDPFALVEKIRSHPGVTSVEMIG